VLSICSGDFSEWVWKSTTVVAPQSYLLTVEYDMYEFNFANTVNYSDLANLMTPRPFMVERGHDDPVGVDEWVSHEYAAVRRFYDKMGLADKREIEFFNGPHTIHGVEPLHFSGVTYNGRGLTPCDEFRACGGSAGCMRRCFRIASVNRIEPLPPGRPQGIILDASH
jgi:hypothetical protein